MRREVKNYGQNTSFIKRPIKCWILLRIFTSGLSFKNAAEYEKWREKYLTEHPELVSKMIEEAGKDHYIKFGD